MKEQSEIIQKLLWREYLRGLIGGESLRLRKAYSLADLKSFYRRYRKLNPSVKKDFSNLIYVVVQVEKVKKI